MLRRPSTLAVLLAAGCATGRPPPPQPPAPPLTVTPARPPTADAPEPAEGGEPAESGEPSEGGEPPDAAEPPPGPPRGPDPRAYVKGGPTLEITRRVRTGVQPKSIAMSPSGDRMYVCNFGLAGRRNVYVYDTTTLEKVGRIDFPGNAAEATVSPDGATVYVSNFGRSRIEVVDAATLEVTQQITVGSNPKFMVIDPERRLLYVSNWSSRSVSAVDLAAGRVDHTLRTGRHPRGLALLDDGTLLVGAMWDHVVQVYAPGSTRPDLEFDACENPRHLMLSPDQSRLYVSCSGDRLLRWFDPRTGEVLGEAPTGLNPRTIGVGPAGRFVAIADFSGSTVTLVDLVDGHYRTHELPRTNQIVGLAVAPHDPLRVFVTSWLTNQLLELRPRDPLPPSDAPVAAR